MRAKLSRTVAGIFGFLFLSFLTLVLGPFLGHRLVASFALEQAEAPLNIGRSHGLEENALTRGRDDSTGAILNLKDFAESARNDHLALGSEPHGFSFGFH